MKEYNLKQSVVIIVVGFALLWACLYCFVFPFLVGGGPAKVPLTKNAERQFLLAMEGFKNAFGSYPSGNEASIVKMLAGDNPKTNCFLILNSQTTNKIGQYVDPWKTPYKFNCTARKVTIQSAGINKMFGDADDVFMTSTNIFQ